MPRDRYTFLREQQGTVQVKRITSKNAAEFSPFLSDPALYTRESGPAAAFGAYLYDVPRGAAELRLGDGYADVVSIQVDGALQGAGIGSALLNKAKGFAADLDAWQLHAEFAVDDQEENPLKDFFRRNGFFPVETSDAVLTIRLSKLVHTSLFQKLVAMGPPKNTISMGALPAEVREDLAGRGGRSIPEERLPWNIRGRIQGELSQGCLSNGRLCAFVLITQRAGRLDFSSAYTDSAHASQFLQLVAQALAKVAQQGVEELSVTLDDPILQGLFEKLAAEDPEILYKRSMQAMMWRLDDELIEDEAESAAVSAEAAQRVTDGMEILVPKLMQLMDYLEDQGTPCNLMLGELPYIMIDNRLDVRYLPMDEQFRGFSLLFTASIRSDRSEEEMQRECAGINANNLYITAFVQDGNLFLRYAVPELDIPITRGQFLACVNEFMRESARFISG